MSNALTHMHIFALKRIVAEGKTIRGTLTGGDEAVLEQFDYLVSKAEEAISIIKKLKKKGKL